MCSIPAQAQEDELGDFGFFDHLSAGISLGTDGIGIDVATPLTDYAALRAGVSFWPGIKYNTNIDLHDTDPALADNVDIEAKLHMIDAKILADVYPFRKSSFHVTVGAFIGNNDIVNARNTSTFITDPSKYGKLGLKLGDYRVSTDQNGNFTADVKVNSFKPYIGIGFGRAVSKKSRFTATFDLGVKFWGRPGLAANAKDEWGNEVYHKFTYKDLTIEDDESLHDAMELADKIIVFPVLNIRLTGRIF